jgi:hypothetical protein
MHTGEGDLASSGDGIVDLANHTERVTLDEPFHHSSDGVESVTRVTHIEILIGSTLYSRSDDQGPTSSCTRFPSVGDGTWRVQDLNAGPSAYVRFAGPTGVRLLLAFIAGGGTVQRAGNEQFEGQAVTHFTVASTPQEFLAALPAEVSSEVLANTASTSSLDQFRVDLFVTDEGLIRKIIQTQADPSKTTTVVLRDFGTSVDIEPPPDSELASSASSSC